MLELSSWLVIGIIYNISHCYLYKKLNNDEFNFNSSNEKVNSTLKG